MSVVIRLKVPIEMHYTVIPIGTYKVNSSQSGKFEDLVLMIAKRQTDTEIKT